MQKVSSLLLRVLDFSQKLLKRLNNKYVVSYSISEAMREEAKCICRPSHEKFLSESGRFLCGSIFQCF